MNLSIVFGLAALILAAGGITWIVRALGEHRRPRFDHRRDWRGR